MHSFVQELDDRSRRVQPCDPAAQLQVELLLTLSNVRALALQFDEQRAVHQVDKDVACLAADVRREDVIRRSGLFEIRDSLPKGGPLGRLEETVNIAADPVLD